jgi:hypothetical protein
MIDITVGLQAHSKNALCFVLVRKTDESGKGNIYSSNSLEATTLFVGDLSIYSIWVTLKTYAKHWSGA